MPMPIRPLLEQYNAHITNEIFSMQFTKNLDKDLKKRQLCSSRCVRVEELILLAYNLEHMVAWAAAILDHPSNSTRAKLWTTLFYFI